MRRGAPRIGRTGLNLATAWSTLQCPAAVGAVVHRCWTEQHMQCSAIVRCKVSGTPILTQSLPQISPSSPNTQLPLPANGPQPIQHPRQALTFSTHNPIRPEISSIQVQKDYYFLHDHVHSPHALGIAGRGKTRPGAPEFCLPAPRSSSLALHAHCRAAGASMHAALKCTIAGVGIG